MDLVETSECVQFGAAWWNLRGLLGLGGRMSSTECYSSIVCLQKFRYNCQTFILTKEKKKIWPLKKSTWSSCAKCKCSATETKRCVGGWELQQCHDRKSSTWYLTIIQRIMSVTHWVQLSPSVQVFLPALSRLVLWWSILVEGGMIPPSNILLEVDLRLSRQCESTLIRL